MGDFKCTCSNPHCDLEEKLRTKADILGVSMATAAFFLNTLKNTAALSPIAGLKEISGGLLVIVSALQDKAEVKGGFNHIVADCLRVTCIVCVHAKRRQNDLTPVIKRAIGQLQHDLEGIKQYAEKMNKRGWGTRFLMGSTDKAGVNEWRQRLTTSWGIFTTELMMDTNYRVTKTAKGKKSLDPAELARQIVEEMVAKQESQISHDTTEFPAPPYNPPPQQPNGHSSEPQWNERDGGDYQYPHANEFSNGNSYSPQGYDDPQSYDDDQSVTPQSYTPRQQHPQVDRNPFRSQTAQPKLPNRRPPAPPPHVHSDPVSPYEPSEYYTPDPYGYPNYGPGYGYHHPPPPHRYYTMPPPGPPSVNNVGSVTNANFGTNYGHINQTSY